MNSLHFQSTLTISGPDMVISTFASTKDKRLILVNNHSKRIGAILKAQILFEL